MRTDALASALLQCLRKEIPTAEEIVSLRRLSGGASQETWAFDLRTAGGTEEMILRRASGGRGTDMMGSASIPLATEAILIRLAKAADVRVPTVRALFQEEDGRVAGFVMDRIAGETIPRKILRDAEFAEARPHLARECGALAARIHSIDIRGIRDFPHASAKRQIEQFRSIYDAFDAPHPVFESAFRWLAEHAPEETECCLVHGDFRNGNFIVGNDGIRAVLDWELSHAGDPMEDLGWLCVNSWRFGEIDRPAGGFGSREELVEGYEAASGRSVDRARVHYWEVLGTLKWGVMCLIMYGVFRGGLDRSVERAAIGRRMSETAIDLLMLLDGNPPAPPIVSSDTDPAEGSLFAHPTSAELLDAVRSFVEDRALPELQGRTAFHARVAVNALAILARQLQLGDGAQRRAEARLREIFASNTESAYKALNAKLCAAIRNGAIDPAQRAVRDHLWRTVIDELAVDQPGYSTYRRILGTN